jgi:hypothetical protein
MHAQPATWDRVKIGSYIQDPTGAVWKVEHDVVRDQVRWLGLVNREGAKRRIPAGADGTTVQLMYLTQDELVAMLEDQLGATLIAELVDGDHVWQCNPWDGMRIEEMKTHLRMMHAVIPESVNDPGQSAGMSTKKQLTECHELQHEKPHESWRPHIHTDKIPSHESRF